MMEQQHISTSNEPVHRRTGVALWRQIADQIRTGLNLDLADSHGRLPSETALAARFSVNRHTVRAAIAALVREGVLRAEQGRGTFAVRTSRLSYPLSRRTRFSTGFQKQGNALQSIFVGSTIETAMPHHIAALGLPPTVKLLRIDTLGKVDDLPVTRSSSWFDASRFKRLVPAYKKTRSMTAALAQLGITDYIRTSTIVDARYADAGDIDMMKLEPGAIVLRTRAVNATVNGQQFQYSETSFAADRVDLHVCHGEES